MNGAVKAARHLEDFRPFDEPPPPPSFPPFDAPGSEIAGRSGKRPSPIPRRRLDDNIFARPVGPPPRLRGQELQARARRDVGRRHRSPTYDDDSAYSTDDSYHSPRRPRGRSTHSTASRGPASTKGGGKKSPAGPISKKSGPGNNKTAGPGGDPAARRKQLDQHFTNKEKEKPGLLKNLEEVVTPLRVGILLGCFDLIGGTLTIWMTKRRAAKEKEAEAEKLALAAQAAEGAGEEPVAPRGGARKKRDGRSDGSSSSRSSGGRHRRRDYSESETESDSDDYNRAAKGQAPGGRPHAHAHAHIHRGRR